MKLTEDHQYELRFSRLIAAEKYSFAVFPKVVAHEIVVAGRGFAVTTIFTINLYAFEWLPDLWPHEYLHIQEGRL